MYAQHVNTRTVPLNFISSSFFMTLFYLCVMHLQFFGLILAAYVQGLINVDYESEVEDDILPIFRKGEVRIKSYQSVQFHSAF